jgi:hypothetical protein
MIISYAPNLALALASVVNLPQFGASLTDDARSVIYNHVFIIQVTDLTYPFTTLPYPT